MSNENFQGRVAHPGLLQTVERPRIALPARRHTEIPVTAGLPVQQPVFEARLEAEFAADIGRRRWAEHRNGAVEDRIVTGMILGLGHGYAYGCVVAA